MTALRAAPADAPGATVMAELGIAHEAVSDAVRELLGQTAPTT